LNYLKTVIRVQGKIGVYGRSLGGIATCHLAQQVDMVIVDRSFSNLHEVAEKKFHGESARILFKLATGGWRATNEIDLVKPRSCKDEEDDRQCYKVLTCDVADEIVDLHSSLMIGVAKQSLLKYKQENQELGILTDKEAD